MPRSNKVTFADIARLTGFSKTTISRYFNKPETVTTDNQAVIREALDKLQYKENKVARVLAKGRTEIIGIVVPDLYHHFYSEILGRLLDTYEQFGYKFLVFVGDTREEIERRYIDELMAYQIEGLIVMSHTISSGELSALRIPVVTIEREDQSVSSVNTDNYQGGRMAAELLHRSGCDVLLHVHSIKTGPSIPAYERLRGFEDYCTENHLPYEVFRKTLTKGHEHTKEAMKEVLEEAVAGYGDRKKGFFLSSDTYAGVLLNLIVRQHGYFPEDYSIVGFDNSAVSREGIYTISTVGQQTEDMAVAAMEILQEQLAAQKEGKADSFKPVHRLITPVLYTRETT